MKRTRKLRIMVGVCVLATCAGAVYVSMRLRSPEQLSIEILLCHFGEHRYSRESQANVVMSVHNSSVSPGMLRIVAVERRAALRWEPVADGEGRIIRISARSTTTGAVVVPGLDDEWRMRMEVYGEPGLRERLTRTMELQGAGQSWREAWKFSRHVLPKVLFEVVSPPIPGRLELKSAPDGKRRGSRRSED